MREEWTGNIVSRLHVNEITRKELAERMGLTATYISMLLNGQKVSNGSELRMNEAIDEILLARKMATNHGKTGN